MSNYFAIVLSQKYLNTCDNALKGTLSMTDASKLLRGQTPLGDEKLGQWIWS